MRLLYRRLSLICFYIVLVLLTWTTKLAVEETGRKSIVLDVLSGVVMSYEGLFDACVMGNLCGRVCCCGGGSSKSSGGGHGLPRQVEDSRIRLGQSVTTDYYYYYGNEVSGGMETGSSAECLSCPLEVMKEEDEEGGGGGHHWDQYAYTVSGWWL